MLLLRSRHAEARRAHLLFAPVASAILLGFASPAGAQQLAAAQRAAIAEAFLAYDATTPGCILGVGQAGHIAYADAWGMANLEHDVPLAPGMISEIGSVSKQFTAAAVVLLAQDGRLSLDDEVRRHFPEFPDFGSPVTIRQLLNHTSGLRDQFGLLELAGRPNGTTVSTVEEVVDLTLRQRTLNFEPGTQYLYSNTGYTFLNALVERVSGSSFAEFTTRRIFRPLGMNDTQWRDDFTRIVKGRVLAYRPDGDGFRQELPFSNLHGSGGLLTTVRDMIIWTHALHQDRVGRPGFLAEMTRVGRLADGRDLTYALGLTVGEQRSVREIAHGGSTAGYRAWLAHYPQHDLTVAVQCNVASANATALGRAVATAVLGDAFAPVEAPARPATVAGANGPGGERVWYNPVTHQVARGAEPRTSSPGDAPAAAFVAMPAWSPEAAELERFSGEYYNDETGSTIRATVEDERLVLRYAPARSLVLAPAFADAFTSGGTTIVFERAANGAPAGFAYHAGRVRNIRFEKRR